MEPSLEGSVEKRLPDMSMASTPSNDGKQQEVDDCVQAFKSGDKLMVEQLLRPRIQQPAVVRTGSL